MKKKMAGRENAERNRTGRDDMEIKAAENGIVQTTTAEREDAQSEIAEGRDTRIPFSSLQPQSVPASSPQQSVPVPPPLSSPAASSTLHPFSSPSPVRGIPRETTRLLRESETGVGVRLYYCGSESCTPGHSFGPAVRSHYLIHFIRSGKGSYLRRGTVYSLKKGDAFLILPGETTKYMADTENPWDYTWVAFDGAGAEALLASCGFSMKNVVFHAENEIKGEKLIRQTEAFEARFQDERLNFLEILGHFYLLFSCMHTDAPGTGWGYGQNRGTDGAAEPGENRKADSGNERDEREERDSAGDERNRTAAAQELYFHQAAEYLRHNFSYPVTVEQLARYVGVSRSYLYKTFINCCGTSIQQYLIGLRLREACSLLTETQRGITDIAYSCGFTDSPSFCRQFRRAYGQTPLQFRRRMCASRPSQPSHTSR